MQYLNLEKNSINLQDYKKRSAQETDFKNLITESTCIKINDKIEIVYVNNIEEDMNPIYNAISSIKYNKSTRTNGLVSTSRIFGYSPRLLVRNQPCRLTSLANEFPKQHFIVEKQAEIAMKYYMKYNENKAIEHLNLTKEKILPEYIISNTMYTSGIINENNPLKYHFDAGNFKNTWSAMFAFRKDTQGGYLSIPQLNIGIEIKNNSLLLFDGQSLLHGVTPIKKLTRNAKRYTIVYYSLQQMWNCKPYDEEIKIMRNKRDEIEKNKLKNAGD